MIYTKKLTDEYFLETQLRTYRHLGISFDLHYSDGEITGHQGVFFSIHIFKIFFEFNIYNINHNEDDNNENET